MNSAEFVNPSLHVLGGKIWENNLHLLRYTIASIMLILNTQ